MSCQLRAQNVSPLKYIFLYKNHYRFIRILIGQQKFWLNEEFTENAVNMNCCNRHSFNG